jgi:hypothetical protein
VSATGERCSRPLLASNTIESLPACRGSASPVPWPHVRPLPAFVAGYESGSSRAHEQVSVLAASPCAASRQVLPAPDFPATRGRGWEGANLTPHGVAGTRDSTAPPWSTRRTRAAPPMAPANAAGAIEAESHSDTRGTLHVHNKWRGAGRGMTQSAASSAVPCFQKARKGKGHGPSRRALAH